MASSPMLSLLLMYVRFVAVPGMDRISTNGRCIFFDPSYLNRLRDEELDFVLSRQILHILCKDINRPQSYAFSNYHYACDLRINAMLMNEKAFSESRYLENKIKYRLPGVLCDISKLTREEILANILFDLDVFDNAFKNRHIIDSDVYWGKAPLAVGCTLILSREESEYLNILTDETLSADGDGGDKWDERAASAYNLCALGPPSRATDEGGGDEDGDADGDEDDGEDEDGDADGVGSVAYLMKRIIKRLHKPSIDWRKILNDFVHEQVIEELKAVDLNTLSPYEAMSFLFDIKKRLR